MPNAAKPHSKLQRWTDLIAPLLARQYPITFDDLAHEVPARRRNAHGIVLQTWRPGHFALIG